MATLVSIVHVQECVDCKELHHPLLHSDQQKMTTSQNTSVKSEQRPLPPPMKRIQENDELIVKAGSPREGDKESTAEKKVTSSSDATLVSGNTGGIALRAIPVYLERRLRVNALLDDASTKTYIDNDVVAEMGLQGRLQKINISVLNGQVESFETTPVKCII